MFLDLLHFGSGSQALHYLFFCLLAILGTVQGAAIRFNRSDLTWFEGRSGYALSLLLVAGSFVWFFVTDEEIFIPGLAGGELFTIFAAAFLTAIPATRLINVLLAAIRGFLVVPERSAREEEPLP